MALINCQNCNNQVSEKAKKCPHCGILMQEARALKLKISCPECGQEISEETIVCPSCGFPLKEQRDEQESSESAVQETAEVKFFCPECGKEIKEDSVRCPSCGFPLQSVDALSQIVVERTESPNNSTSSETELRKKNIDSTVIAETSKPGNSSIVTEVSENPNPITDNKKELDRESAVKVEKTTEKNSAILAHAYENLVTQDTLNNLKISTQSMPSRRRRESNANAGTVCKIFAVFFTIILIISFLILAIKVENIYKYDGPSGISIFFGGTLTSIFIGMFLYGIGEIINLLQSIINNTSNFQSTITFSTPKDSTSTPTWICSGCHTTNSISSYFCRNCGKYKN